MNTSTQFAVGSGHVLGGYPLASKQGTRHISPHHREAACFMGGHAIGFMAYLPWSFGFGARAPHSLRTAPCGYLVPMCQSSGSCVCRAVQKLAIGLNTIQWTTEACLAAAGHTYHGFECELASYGAPTALGCASSTASGGLRCLYKRDIQPTPMTQYPLLDVYCKG